MQNLKNIIIFAVVALIIAGAGLFLFSPKNTTKTSINQSAQQQGQQTSIPSSGGVIQGQGTVSITPGQASTQGITLTAAGFNPQAVTVKAGTRITWANQSGTIGDVDSYPKTSYPAMNFGTFNNGSMVSLVLTKPGTYHYNNQLHPIQQGTIIVQ